MDGIPGLPGRSGLPGKKVRNFEMLGQYDTSVLKYIWTRSVHCVYVLVLHLTTGRKWFQGRCRRTRENGSYWETGKYTPQCGLTLMYCTCGNKYENIFIIVL